MQREQPAANAVVVGGVDDIYPNAAGFPRFAVLRAAAVDTRDDLLSLLGIPAIAIVGAVANAVFPRAHHGLFSHSWLRDPISIVTGLMLLEATWLAFRVGMHQKTSKRRYAIDGRVGLQFLSFNVYARTNPQAELPSAWFRVRTPTGKYVDLQAHPPDRSFPLELPPGYTAQFLGQQDRPGLYMVRVYRGWPALEVARESIFISPESTSTGSCL